MGATNTFTRYGIHDHAKDKIDFALMQMPDFFTDRADRPMRPHIHSFYQIIWFRKGHGRHYVDFNEYPVEDNTLFFISPGQIHWFDHNTRTEGVIMHFNESFLSDEGHSETVFLKYNMFNSFDAEPYYKVCEACKNNLLHIVGNIEAELAHSDDFAHEDYLKYLVKMFLIEVQRMGKRGERRQLSITNSGNRTFVKFRQMLEHHYRHIHTVKEYADYLNVTPKSLSNYVQAAAHTTPLNLIGDRITLEAKRLLLHSDLKVKEVAEFLGFDDPSYFVKFFKRQTGYLPAEFRSANHLS